MIKAQKTLVFLILVSFLSLIIGSSLAMRHSMDAESSGGCPFSLTDTSLCLQNTIAAVTHHLSAYHAFLNAQPTFGMAALLALILLSIVALYVFGHILHSSSPPVVPVALLARTLSFRGEPRQRIIRWLSLFENSPSLL